MTIVVIINLVPPSMEPVQYLVSGVIDEYEYGYGYGNSLSTLKGASQ